MKLIDITGQVFGRLTVLSRHHVSGNGTPWLCRCECGVEKAFDSGALRSGDTRSCGCLRRDYMLNRPATRQLAYGESCFNALLSNYRRRARTTGRAFSLSATQFRELVEKHCHYCGAEPTQVFRIRKSAHGEFSYNGLDRVDNGLGYVPGNVVPCCGDCNIAKHTRSSAEFLAWAERVHRHQHA